MMCHCVQGECICSRESLQPGSAPLFWQSEQPLSLQQDIVFFYWVAHKDCFQCRIRCIDDRYVEVIFPGKTCPSSGC